MKIFCKFHDGHMTPEGAKCPHGLINLLKNRDLVFSVHALLHVHRIAHGAGPITRFSRSLSPRRLVLYTPVAAGRMYVAEVQHSSSRVAPKSSERDRVTRDISAPLSVHQRQ